MGMLNEIINKINPSKAMTQKISKEEETAIKLRPEGGYTLINEERKAVVQKLREKGGPAGVPLD